LLEVNDVNEGQQTKGKEEEGTMKHPTGVSKKLERLPLEQKRGMSAKSAELTFRGFRAKGVLAKKPNWQKSGHG